MFSKSYCPFCRRTKALRKSGRWNQHPALVIELDTTFDGPHLQRCLAQLIGQHIGGNDDFHAFTVQYPGHAGSSRCDYELVGGYIT